MFTDVKSTIEVLQVAHFGVAHRENQRLDAGELKEAFHTLTKRQQAFMDSPTTQIQPRQFLQQDASKFKLEKRRLAALTPD